MTSTVATVGNKANRTKFGNDSAEKPGLTVEVGNECHGEENI
jgi:hypothetical protein